MNPYPPLNDISHSPPRIHVDRPVINQMVLFPKYDPHAGFLRLDGNDAPSGEIRGVMAWDFVKPKRPPFIFIFHRLLSTIKLAEILSMEAAPQSCPNSGLVIT